MSVHKLTRGDYETFTINTQPKAYFSSSSSGITGSINVSPVSSHIIKQTSQVTQSSAYLPHDDGSNLDSSFKSFLDIKSKSTTTTHADLTAQQSAYMNDVRNMPVHDPSVSVKRLVPMYSGSMEYVNYLKQSVFQSLANEYSHAGNQGLSYSNYNSIKLFSRGYISDPKLALLYPNAAVDAPGVYTLTGPFTLSFNIKLDSDNDFVGGTVMQLSGNYAVSVRPGTLDGRAGLQLQLSSSATKNPWSPATLTLDTCYGFDDVITRGDWHNVAFRWGTSAINNGTGSLIVDGIQAGTFVLPSASFCDELKNNQPSFLTIGNFFTGPNANVASRNYFSNEDSLTWGVKSANVSHVEPTGNYFYDGSSRANFELHDICIRNCYLTDTGSLLSTPKLPDPSIKFYLPPFFNEDTNFKASLKVPPYGGMRTHIMVNGSTSTPFNVGLAFGKGIHYMNVENFTTDFANLNTPRHIGLETTLDFTSSSNDLIPWLLDEDASKVGYRNLFILPCDDGNFMPVQSRVTGSVRQTSILFPSTLASIDLSTMVSASLIPPAVKYSPGQAGDVAEEDERLSIYNIFGFDPSTTQVRSAASTAIQDWINGSNTVHPTAVGYDRQQPTAFFYKFKDPSTTQLVFFDISNLYYGDMILPGSFTISDSNLRGSRGKISITLKDDGNGGLYRANCSNPATFNNVGNIFYNQGIVVIKNPSLYFFGEKQYEMSFRGSRNVHVLKLETLVPRNKASKSSNPSYIEGLKPSADQIDENEKFVYVTGVNFHDDNLNVVLRTKLAQPIIKRRGDKILVRTKLDF